MYSEEIKKKDKTEYLPMLFTVSALFIFVLAAGLGMRYVPERAVNMMAEINRIDFFGMTSADPVIFVGYQLKRLAGISSVNAVCNVIPLFFYCVFVLLMWSMADCFFSGDTLKRSLCFLAEACLVFLWDCGSSPAYTALHCLSQTEGIVMTLALPYVFLSGMRLFIREKSESRILCVFRFLLLIICILSAILYSSKALGLMIYNIVIFALLIIIRRYLPWLKSSE